MTPGLEQELLRRYVEENDAEAFGALVESHRDMVFSVCKRILRNGADAEDAAQNSFLQLARKAARLRAPIAGWLHHIALQTSINMHRQNIARTVRETKSAELRAPSAQPSWDQLQGVVDEVIAKLPDRLRVPVIMHYLEGRKQDDIAAELGITQSAVSKRLAQGIDAMRKRLTKSGTIVSGVALASLLAAKSVEAAPATLTSSVGKMAYVGLASGSKATATLGGIALAKWGIVVAVAALVTGGVVAQKVMSAETVRQPVAIVQPAPPVGPAPVTPETKGIHGTVLLPDGKPAAAAKVKLFYYHDASGYGSKWVAETMSDAQGKFALKEPEFERPALTFAEEPGQFRLFVVALRPGCSAAIVPVDPDGAGDVGVMRLSPGHDEGFTVVDAKGLPFKGAEVVIESLDLPDGNWAEMQMMARRVLLPAVFRSEKSDEKGVAVLRDAPAQGFYVRVVGDGLGSTVGYPSVARRNMAATIRAIIAGDSGSGRVEASVALQTIKGRVVADDIGTPLAGIIVYGSGQQYTQYSVVPWWAISNDKGEFTLNPEPSTEPIRALVAIDPSRRPAYASASVPVPEGRGEGITIRMAKGTPVVATVRDAHTAKGISGVQLRTTIPSKQNWTSETRLTDVRGECRFGSWNEGQVELVEGPPGHTFVGQPQRKSIARDEEKDSVEFELDLVPMRNVELVMTLPEKALGMRVCITTGTAGTFQAHRTTYYRDAPGRFLFPDVPVVEGTFIYVCSVDAIQLTRSENMSEAQLRKIIGPPPPPMAARFVFPKEWTPGPVTIALQPAAVGEVELRDDKGNPVQAEVDIGFANGGSLPRADTKVVGGRSIVTIAGLLPDMDYPIWINNAKIGDKAVYRSDFTPDGPWKFGKDEKTPKLVLTYDPTLRPGPPPPPKPRTADDLKRDCDALGPVAVRQDVVDEKLTWLFLKQGVALSNAKTFELKTFRELLGEMDFVPSSIAFSADKVWVGTNKGLFAWDRKDMFWARFAIGGEHVDLPVKDLALDGTNLTVTIDQDDKPRKFEFDTAAAKWHEVP